MPFQVIPDPSHRYRTVTKTVATSYTRPADTAVYAAGDVLADSSSAATILTFPNVVRSIGKQFRIDGAEVIYSSNQATKPDLELWLFDTSIVMQHDNIAWNPTDAEVEKFIAQIKFPLASIVPVALIGGNGNSYITVTDAAPKWRSCAAGATSIYGVVLVKNTYTPLSAEKFTFKLFVTQE